MQGHLSCKVEDFAQRTHFGNWYSVEREEKQPRKKEEPRVSPSLQNCPEKIFSTWIPELGPNKVGEET